MEFRMNGEASFEAKFAQMANATLAERVPSLQEEHVGFQLIDKNDEDTKAVGVSAYVINNLFAYIPVFFINGELKGMELLYVFQRDVFVPADDSWISMLKQEGINALGKPTDSNESRNPTDFFYAPEDVSTPEYEGRFTYKTATAQVHLSLKRSFEKLADDRNSHIPLDEFKSMAAVPADFASGGLSGLVKEALKTVDLFEQLPEMDKTAKEAFVYTILKNPDFANAMFKHYTVDEVGSLMKTAAEEITKAGDEDVDEVTFMTSNATGDMVVIPDVAKKLLVENGIYVKDTRTNFSKIYQDEIDTSVFQNPCEPNIYDVMLHDGTTERYLILFPSPLTQSEMYIRQWDHQNADREVALIPMDGKKYHCCKARDVWCKIAAGVTNAQQAILQKGQEATLRTMGRLRKQDTKKYEDVFGGNVILVQSPKCAFQTRFVNDEGSKGEILLRRTAGEPYVDRNFWRDNPIKDLCTLFVGAEGELNVYDYSMIIPEGTRIYVEDRDNNIRLGAPKVVGLRFAKEASSIGMSTLGLHVIGERVAINFKDERTQPLHKHAAIKYLTLEHKIEGSQAITLIKQASEAKHGRKQFRVIHAADAGIFDKNASSINNMADYGTSVNPPFNGGPRGKRENATTYKTRTGTGRPLSGPMDASNQPIMPQSVIDKATQASEAGITEVFNVEVMRGLIDVADIAQLKKGYLAKMVKGMDATGRILFLYYWHQDKFEETYGMNDTQKLENTLRSVFQSMGDLILFLREKSTYNDNFSENLFGNLSEDIGTAAAM